MCLLIYNKNFELKTAKKAIKVFKIVRSLDTPNWVEAYYNDFEYKKGELATSDITIDRCYTDDANGIWIINKGFHSFSFDINTTNSELLQLVALGNKKSKNCQVYDIKGKGPHYMKIASFEIPAGADYIYSENLYVSNQLIYTGESSIITNVWDVSKFINKYK